MIQKKAPNLVIAWSSITPRFDTDSPQKHAEFAKEVHARNEGMRALCKKYGVHYIDNANFTKECLGRQGLHPNKRGNATLAGHWLTFLGNI